jgi:hypothetical protein
MKMQTDMAAHQKMMAEMKGMDQRLGELVARMSAAQGAAKVDAMEAVIKALVEQRSAMNTHMMAMHEAMMQQMMAPKDSQPAPPADAPATSHTH